MIPADPIVFTLYIHKLKFINKTNLVGPQEFELSELHCILYLFHSAMFINNKNMHVGVDITNMMV